MSNLPNLDLKITINDSDLKQFANESTGAFKKIQGEIKKTDDAIEGAFDTKDVDQFSKSVDNTGKKVKGLGKEIDDTDKKFKGRTKSINSSLRSVGRTASRVSRGIRGAFAATGIGVFILGITSLLSGFGDLKDKALDSLGGIGDFFRNAIDSARDFLSTITFGLISSSTEIANALQKETEKISNLAAKTARTANDIFAKEFATLAKLRGASNEEIARLDQERLSKKQENLSIEIDEEKKALVEIEIARQELQDNLIRAERAGNKTRIAELGKELELNNQATAERIKAIAELRLARAESALAFKEINANIEKDRKEAIDKRRREREREAEEEKRRLEKEARELEKALEQQLQLRLEYLVTTEEAEKIRNENRAKQREQQAKEVIQDEDELNAILLAIQLDKELKEQEITDRFAMQRKDKARKEREDELKAAEDDLQNNIEFRQSLLEETQALERAEFFSIQRTENDIKNFEQQQQKERALQELEFQKERLGLVLEFGDLRTDAEKQVISQQIAAIDALIAETKAKKAEAQSENEENGGFLQRLLGLDDEQLKALQQAANFAKDQINSLLETRINALQTEIDARDKRLQDLRGQLQAETALLEAGKTANVQGTLDQIAQQEAARQDAIKKQRAAVIAQEALDTITQFSSLATASAQIFAAYAPLQPIGIPLAIAQIALMFGAFAGAKAQAFKAISAGDVALNTGGRIMTGEKDTNGGKGLRIEGTNMKVGRGEWVLNERTSDKQNDFIEVFNSGVLDDVDLLGLVGRKAPKDILRVETKSKKEFARAKEQLRVSLLKNAIDGQTESLKGGLDKLYNKPQIAATDDYYLIHKEDSEGNVNIKKINVSKSNF